MAEPKYAQRVARIPELLALVATYPDGLTLAELSRRFDTDPVTLHEDLTTYLDLESWGWTFDIFTRSQVEFAQTDDADPGATVVRVASDDPSGLGVEHLAAGDLAAIYTAGAALLDVQPDDEDLAAALVVIAETMYGEDPDQELHAPPTVPSWNRYLAELADAVDRRRRVRLVYSRAWREGVLDRVVEPLRLIQTHRGWELDAGPVGPEGNLRTYLLTNLRDVRVLDETFEPPSQLASRLEEQRRTTTVRMELQHDARWAADMYAERVHVVEPGQGKECFVADLELLPPAGERVGLVMLASGPETRVIRPGTVLPEAVALIEELLVHHES